MKTACLDLANQFQTTGFAGPFRAVTEAQAPELRAAYCTAAGIDLHHPGAPSQNLAAWHHHQRWAYDLATRPEILDRVESLLGPDIYLWAWFSWYKQPHTGKRIPWHQDAGYWPIEPKKNVTAWVALDHCTPDNGCLRVIPGSHRASITHSAVNDATSWFDKGADPAAVDESKAIDVILRPGEFVLFNEGTLHGSNPNSSDLPRYAFSLRYTSPEVNLHGDQWNDERVKAFLVRGEDRFHVNDRWLGTAPA
jgi:ectoine hydroxylase-related dioxygenase (phytanoyl-CoA dioxygenase family)